MACLYVSGPSMSSCVVHTKSSGSVKFVLLREITRMCSGSRLVFGAFS